MGRKRICGKLFKHKNIQELIIVGSRCVSSRNVNAPGLQRAADWKEDVRDRKTINL